MNESTNGRVATAELTDYERNQIEKIAAWKSEPPHPLLEIFKRITLTGAHVVEKLLPDAPIRAAIDRTYQISELISGQADIKRRAGVQDLNELLRRSLEESDRLAHQVALSSRTFAAVEGAITGAGGTLTTLIDIPVLFVLALRTILKIGHCYGYPLDRSGDKPFVLGVLLASTSSSLEVRRNRLHQLRDIEDWLIEETQEDIITEEVLSFLFQLEIFEGVPGVGTVSGALLNLAFIRRVEETARRVFQERWLRHNGKVQVIPPAEAHPRIVAHGWSGVVARTAHGAGYAMGFGAALPACFVASLFQPAESAMARGLRDGAVAARTGVDRFLGRFQAGNGAAAPIQTSTALALAPS